MWAYVFGKQICVKFLSSATRLEGILHLLCRDVFGPRKVPSLGKIMCYVTFIDDLSRKSWVYFLWNENDVFNKLKGFNNLVEN